MSNAGNIPRSLLRISRGPARGIVCTRHKEKGFGYRTPPAAHAEHELIYLHQCSSRPLDAADVAAHVGLSASHLRALVKKETGLSMRRHMRDFRIETARRLLRESIDNVATICYRVGYGSLPNFCTAFKKTVGMTPLEYSRSLGLPKAERTGR